MIRPQDQRTALLLGERGLALLNQARVAVVGLGGVGAYALEALVRAGIGHISIIDFDCVQASNINRQLIASHDTIGISKVSLCQARALSINPELEISTHQVFVDGESMPDCLGNSQWVIDAIDSVGSKVELIRYSLEHKLEIVSVFGAGRRLDPSKIQSGDISKTSVCPLARVVRKSLREKGIKRGLTAVWSTEEPILSAISCDSPDVAGKESSAIGSISYMPAIMGLWAASVLIDKILNRDKET